MKNTNKSPQKTVEKKTYEYVQCPFEDDRKEGKNMYVSFRAPATYQCYSCGRHGHLSDLQVVNLS